MTIGSAYNAEFFSGTIGEILRWTRPLSGGELRTVFDALSAKWDIPVAGQSMRRSSRRCASKRSRGPTSFPPLSIWPRRPRASAWLNLWSRWDWHWIELSVRRAVEQGANTIRLIGDVNAVYTGADRPNPPITSRLQQVVDLCDSLEVQFLLLRDRPTPQARRRPGVHRALSVRCGRRARTQQQRGGDRAVQRGGQRVPAVFPKRRS